MRRVGHVIACGFLPFLVSCTGQEDAQLRGLLGEGDLQQAKLSSNELVQIRIPGSGQSASQQLQYTLQADGVLIVDRFELPRAEDQEGEPRAPRLQQSDRLILSDEAAAGFRQRVALFRPSELSADGPFILPKDCAFTYHGSSKAVIEYRASDRRAGLFILQRACDEPSAKQLEEELRALIANLPQTEAGRGFNW